MISNKLTYCIAIIVSLFIGKSSKAQNLELDSCIQLAIENYPQIQQRALIKNTTAFTLSNVQKGKLPQVQIVGHATYQSDVTSLPNAEMVGAPQLSKDQYILYGEILQPITGIAVVKQQEKITLANGKTNQASLETKLYQIKQRVSDIYFGILILQEQLAQLTLTEQDIQVGLVRVEASVKYGISLKSNFNILKAELLQIEQKIIELDAAKESYLAMLGQFIGKPLNGATELMKPNEILLKKEITRPELSFFKSQMETIALQNELLDKTNLPNVSLFLQSGVGRPALNFLSNDIEPYYIGGLRLSWNLSNYYTSKRQKQLHSIERQRIQSEQETFLFNTQLSLTQNETQIQKTELMILKDEQIISLRNEILKTAQGQLENGVITANEYKTVVFDADRARQNRSLHQIELLKLKYDHLWTSGD